MKESYAKLKRDRYMKKFSYSQSFKECINDALSRFGGQADSSRIREAVSEGKYELVEAFLRSGATRPTQFQDEHEMLSLLHASMNEREIYKIAELARARAATFERV